MQVYLSFADTVSENVLIMLLSFNSLSTMYIFIYSLEVKKVVLSCIAFVKAMINQMPIWDHIVWPAIQRRRGERLFIMPSPCGRPHWGGLAESVPGRG